MLRTYDVVLAEGTFRVVLTPKKRLMAVLDAPTTPLGPLHVALEIGRDPFMPPHITVLGQSHDTAGIFDDIGHAVSKAAEGVSHVVSRAAEGASRAAEKAAEGAFNTVTHAATTIAQPAFNVLKGAAGEAAHLIAHATPFLPDATRRQIDQAAHVVMRARLGDMNAKQFVRTIASAAKSGVQAAQHVGDVLLEANKFVAKAVDVPVLLASQIPGVGDFVKSVSPLQHYEQMVSAVQKGDLRALKEIAERDLSMAQGVISLVPGIGNGVSAAIGAGLAALEGGSPLEIAIRAAYGAIPIPPGLRNVTDAILDSVLALLQHPHDLSEAVLQAARERVPAGLPRDVFDTLVQLVIKRVPLQQVAASTLEHYVQQYAPVIDAQHVVELPHVQAPGRLVQPLHLFHT